MLLTVWMADEPSDPQLKLNFTKVCHSYQETSENNSPIEPLTLLLLTWLFQNFDFNPKYWTLFLN